MVKHHQIRSRFISLKWKIVFLLSIVLLVTNSFLASISSTQIKSQFNDNREFSKLRQTHELNGLIRNSYSELENIASIIQIIISSSHRSDAKNTLHRIFDENTLVLDAEWGLDFISIQYSNSSRLYEWETEDHEEVISSLHDLVTKQLHPIHWLSCNPECIQYLATPILTSDGTDIIMITGRTLTDIVQRYEILTGSSLIILSPETKSLDISSDRKIRNWGYELSLATSNKNNGQILDRISYQTSISRLDSRHTHIAETGDFYEIYSVSPEKLDQESTVKFIIINNITDATNLMMKNIDLIHLYAILGFVLSETLLLLYLWLPVSRIKSLTSTLPLLSSGKYAQARERLHSKQKIFPDEIDALSESTLDLNSKLETLNQDLENHTKKLETQRDALLLERDFNTDLLDTAQAIIITHDVSGTIISINNYGLSLCECDESNLLGKDIEKLFGNEDTGIYRSLESLRNGIETHFNHENTITTNNDKHICLSWYHSRVSHTSTDDAIILSIGLDMTARHQAEERLGWIADHDPLTKLSNRRRFQIEFDRVLDESKRYQRNGALLFIDLDHFKLVNDTHGHHIGDQLLKSVANSMRNATRQSDILARLGGDEFAMIIPDTNAANAQKVARKIMYNLNRIHIGEDNNRYRASGSIGITLFPEHGVDPQILMGNADIAMYMAKQNGRGVCHIYNDDDHAREIISNRMEWKQRIDVALENDEFTLFYQPILNLANNKVSHYEALIRLRDGDSVIPPGAFIPHAEQTGQIIDIDRWVIHNSLKSLKEFHDEKRLVSISINLSGRVVDDPNIISYIKECIVQTQANPSNVIFEITETAAVADISAARSLMLEIAELGCKFSLDDFGVGFSSFYYLKQLPVDYVKIDGTFIKNLTTDSADQVFVKALRDVASGMNKHTIAEFVEDHDTLMLLKSYGINYAQGYHVGKPSKELLGCDTFEQKDVETEQLTSNIFRN